MSCIQNEFFDVWWERVKERVVFLGGHGCEFLFECSEVGDDSCFFFDDDFVFYLAKAVVGKVVCGDVGGVWGGCVPGCFNVGDLSSVRIISVVFCLCECMFGCCSC